MMKGKAYVLCDGQWGSTGKGKLAGYLASKIKPTAVACDFMTNAGHTWIGDDGTKIMTQQIPTGALFTDGPILLGPGCGISISTLLTEVTELNAKGYDIRGRLFIHPHAFIIDREHAEIEACVTKRVASTMKGCGAALADKVVRHPRLRLAKDAPELKDWIADTVRIATDILDNNGVIQVEGAQGFCLSLDWGVYPYVTSRNITPTDILLRSGIPAQYLGTVFGSLRTYPIRVGNVVEDGVEVGFSGPCYPDQQELDWETLERRSGGTNLVERTTVTGRVRRLFNFSFEQLNHFIKMCAPDYLFLNFANHIDAGVAGVTKCEDLSESVLEVLNTIYDRMDSDVPIGLIGTGPKQSDMIDFIWGDRTNVN